MDVAERVRRDALAAWRGLILFNLTLFVGIAVGTLAITAIGMVTSWIGIILIPLAVLLLRWHAANVRGLIREWTGIHIEIPYLPEPQPRHDAAAISRQWQRAVHLLCDRATWRDLLWTMTDPVVSAFTAALPALLIVDGVFGLLLAAGLWTVLGSAGQDWYLFVPLTGWAVMPAVVLVALAQIWLGLRCAPALLNVHGRWCRLLLAPTEKARLALRVQRLTETRSDAVDSQAAELRRIERDLHDGAQARLVAVGMSLGAIEQLMDRDPERARFLLAEARKTSASALSELRDLVRGIHPPVLADRGLVDAVRALALDHPMQVDVSAEMPGRPEAAVESAAYFAVAEALTNAAKHSGASRVWIDIRCERGRLRITVTDDGQGGADPERGSGLRGIERRIGAFDGVLAVSSPPGGPTIVTLELPVQLTGK